MSKYLGFCKFLPVRKTRSVLNRLGPIRLNYWTSEVHGLGISRGIYSPPTRYAFDATETGSLRLSDAAASPNIPCWYGTVKSHFPIAAPRKEAYAANH